MTPKRVYEKLDGLSVVLFSNGWFFILPFLLLYLFFKYLHLPVAGLKTLFICLHLCYLPLLINYLWKVCRKGEVSDFVFWIGLLVLFLIPGAYLEFPSDPWEHFRRIYAWQANHFIDENIVSDKFSYFWGWTLMSAVRPLYRRTAADIYGAFWELLLAYQFYLLALRLGFSRSWARIQVLATVCLFGANVFSFYRYYALSSTVPAYIAYLAAVIVIMDLLDGKKKQALLLPLLVLIIYFNHKQELLLLLVSTGALFLNEGYERGKFWRALTYFLPLAVIASWLLGAWVVRHPQFIPVRVWNPGPPYVSEWGTFRIWDPGMPYFEAIGIHGLLGLAFAILFFNKYRRIAMLSLMPVGLLLFSPYVLTFTALVGDGDNYLSWRVLYAFPASFILVAGLKEVIDFLIRRLSLRSKVGWLQFSVVSIVVLVSLVPYFPYRGRLWFLLHKPPTELSLQRIDLTSQWLFDNYHRSFTCLLVADRATGTVLAATLALPPVTERLVPRSAYDLVTLRAPFDQYLQSNQVCALLVAIPSKIVHSPPSRVAQLSGHWDPLSVDKNLLPDGNLDGALESVTAAGWTKTFVPPFYWLYVSPQQEFSKSSRQVRSHVSAQTANDLSPRLIHTECTSTRVLVMIAPQNYYGHLS